MKIRLLIDMESTRSFAAERPDLIERRNGKPWIPAGVEYDHPGAWLLVNGGFAEPRDDECRRKCEDNPPTADQQRGRESHERLIAEQKEFYDNRLQYLDEDDDE